ncbi:LWR-salt protein [Halosimplex pelagicum]|uniref:LWR-salt protein n=1 Tax=Halosimplex pelagicum TaxID=869886 RepID=A0A7D5T7G5_9EURY|nr:LWR-salt protein [Halosimplex pelagicum]QLH84128.1 LWR-salt protein [Halosimplex pelagicum]
MSRGEDTGEDSPAAAYVFRVTVRLDPDDPGVWTEPDTFETTVYRAADSPGEPGWLYFRDNLWRGDCGDEAHMRAVAEDALGVAVDSVDFRELRTTQRYLDDLRAAVADDLGEFNASTVDAALSKYLGSSIHVTDEI